MFMIHEARLRIPEAIFQAEVSLDQAIPFVVAREVSAKAKINRQAKVFLHVEKPLFVLNLENFQVIEFFEIIIREAIFDFPFLLTVVLVPLSIIPNG